MKEPFNLVYNGVEQVKRCAGVMLSEEVADAKIAIVIGHNGVNFVSSTDWRLTTGSGIKRILPFSIRPQYPNFLECVAGVSYSGQLEKFTVLPEVKNPKPAQVIIGNEVYDFAPGKALKIYVKPNSRFIATDCLVECEETSDLRIYRVIVDETTLYGYLDEKGGISQT